MEKRGVVQPGTTPDTEEKLAGQKQAGRDAKTESLDDDATKRLADACCRRGRGQCEEQSKEENKN